ncbi:hypothetical protein J5N97_020838 [Dioscorea zingiberensis]|uniref:Uncharacterized protein n=1 Tax=Dioscorea zingiberensis TaxID=325984 RepID=A0A9D5CH60_9LILI|nr:hypothetical protein J5N97_020838 [Dioscorea zingiberensis]
MQQGYLLDGHTTRMGTRLVRLPLTLAATLVRNSNPNLSSLLLNLTNILLPTASSTIIPFTLAENLTTVEFRFPCTNPEAPDDPMVTSPSSSATETHASRSAYESSILPLWFAPPGQAMARLSGRDAAAGSRRTRVESRVTRMDSIRYAGEAQAEPEVFRKQAATQGRIYAGRREASVTRKRVLRRHERRGPPQQRGLPSAGGLAGSLWRFPAPLAGEWRRQPFVAIRVSVSGGLRSIVLRARPRRHSLGFRASPSSL